MKDERELFRKRLIELAERSDRSMVPCFTPFMGLMEQDIFRCTEKEFSHVPYTLFGGTEGCERVMARFGDEANCSYMPPFPIVCLKGTPLSAKFADDLTHRDILGAVMNLGIDRNTTGDIVIRDNCFYLFCTEGVALHIEENLIRARHTDLRIERVDKPPKGELYRLERQQINSASERVDGITAQFLKAGRSEVASIIEQRRLFINGRVCENGGKTLKSGDIVSVRGSGRFIFRETVKTTKKGRLMIEIDRFC